MSKTKEEKVELEGVIEEAMPGTLFKVTCEGDQRVLATLSGRLRMNKVRILPNDRVKVEVSPYDPTRGRIIWRL